MKTQEIYDVPKGVTEIHVDDGLHYCLFMKGGEPEFISISGSEDNAKRIAELEAELTEARRLLKEYGHWSPGVHIIHAFLARHGDKS